MAKVHARGNDVTAIGAKAEVDTIMAVRHAKTDNFILIAI
jgi:hypothetical protein